MDLGECMKVHDLALRADYEIASKEQEYFFELDVSCTPTPTKIFSWMSTSTLIAETFLKKVSFKLYLKDCSHYAHY